jgi:hypothetical protein
MAIKSKSEAQNPLMLRCLRLMDAFAKSNDERDFYLDRMEGFILYVDLDKSESEIRELEKELEKHRDRYVLIPKLTFYETKKIMEGFVNEKVYDIDTKEKLLDIIQSKEARENFLEFIYDHHSEYEKWQQFYQERSRIRIIEWLRQNNFYFVFEEDLELSRKLIEGLKRQLFQTKVSKDIANARKTLITKAKTYYSSEALNPRPKRGRPPKQIVKAEIEPQITSDIYTTVPSSAMPFLYTPEITTLSAITFSAKFENEEDLIANRKHGSRNDGEITIESFNAKLASLRSLSNKWLPQPEEPAKATKHTPKPRYDEDEEEEEDEDDDDILDFDTDYSDFDLDEEDEEEDEEDEGFHKPEPVAPRGKTPPKAPAKVKPKVIPTAKKAPPPPPKKPAVTKKAPPPPVKKKAPPPPPPKKQAVAKKAPPPKKAAPTRFKPVAKKAPPPKKPVAKRR